MKKFNRSYSFLKDALREEEGCPWLIRSPNQENLSDVQLFNNMFKEASHISLFKK
jgi:hypothetical protein